jgi:beta-phosphoglucomutase-like phosphatase (HAD superfamily)
MNKELNNSVNPKEYETFSMDDIKKTILDPSISLVFDFDDTIVRTSPLQRKAIESVVAEKVGELAISHEFAMKNLRGKSPEDIFNIVYSHYFGINDTNLIKESVEAREQSLVDQVNNSTANLNSLLFPGIENMIRTLRSQNKPAGIASHSGDKFIQTFMKKALVDGQPIIDIFPETAIVGGDSIRKRSTEITITETPTLLYKPHGFSVFSAAHSLDSSQKNRIFYCGDSATDASCIEANSNLLGLIVNNDKDQLSTLRENYRDVSNIIFINSLSEIFP